MQAGKIRVLPEAIAQKIAAGEVIERPASVVKELMENAIDAGASEIVVELKSGGLQLIRVIDNGEGMAPDDVPLALQRFATSKIRKAEDLFAIETLGFRGEALPSISSVSQMTLRTRPSPSISGTKVVLEGGEIKQISETGCPVGTEIEVHQLFYNFPVRRKFLKSIRTELRYALHHFLRISLVHPAITFKFIHDGRKLEELLKTDSSLVRVEAVLGKEVSGHLEAIQFEEDEIRIEGFVSLPSLSKRNGDGISIYINRRYVKDRIIYKALLDGYRHILPADRYPVAILFIRLSPSSVDVNVHPTKAEVKFKEPEKVYQTVWSSVRRALEETSLNAKGTSLEKIQEVIRHDESQPSFPYQNSWKHRPAPWGEEIVVPKAAEGEGVPWETERRGPYRIVGQLWGTYILCETEGTLLVIDQHAAHERVLYEKLKKKFDEQSVVSETLLLPVLIELSLEESLLFDSAKKAFEEIGFEIEPVGKRLYAIRSIPSFIEHKEAEERVREMLEELSLVKREGEGTAPLHALLISLACHSAIRASFPLRQEEIEELIRSLYPFNPSTTCPHGRPVFLLFSLDELNRRFKRN
jgi:DNA mismatch repair protein MutL